MIKVELSYNPYILETKIKFNNQTPRINSQVEKYVNGPLQVWVKQIPQIFYDEMNGYDFELEFTGTKSDYMEVELAFQEAGVSSKEVRIVHINELDSREQKVAMIDDLLKWLEVSSPENYLAYEQFKEDNYDLFDGFYPYILIQGGAVDTSALENADISLENINRIEELESTNLMNTPILFYVSKDNLRQFQNNLGVILGRKDITKGQLFFMMHPSVDSEKVKRTIQDLGVENPQVVTGIYSEEIKKYMELYPVTEYIYYAIKTLRKTATPIDSELKEKREISNQKNKDINQRIHELETRISNLKSALDSFEMRDNIQLPDSWIQKKEYFLEFIKTWRNRKTKITRDDEAKMVALELDIDLVKLYREFLSALKKDVAESVNNILSVYAVWYQKGEYNLEYSIECKNIENYQTPDMPSVLNQLLEIKNEELVQAKEDIFSHFFRGISEQSVDRVLEVTYSYQKWREYVLSVAEPIVEDVIQSYYIRLTNFEKKAADEYMEHLRSLLDEQTEERNKTAAKLSKDEQILQEHINWITEFCDKLGKIERG